MKDYKVGQRYLLRSGETIIVLRLHANGSIRAEFIDSPNSIVMNTTNIWDRDGFYIDKWTPHDKDIVEGPL